MKLNFSQIYEGWKNNLFPAENLKQYIEEVHQKRITICNTCPLHSKNHKSLRPDDHCTSCGCTLVAKTKCLSCECPLQKWEAVATLEQEQQIKNND